MVFNSDLYGLLKNPSKSGYIELRLLKCLQELRCIQLGLDFKWFSYVMDFGGLDSERYKYQMS